MTRRYHKPPLVEVVCQFNFIPREQWDLAVPGLVYDRLKGCLPKRRVLRRMEAQGRAEQEEVHGEVRLSALLQLLREDERAFAQVGPDMLAVNHLDPYPGWADFEPFVNRCFGAYVDVAPPQGLARIGLRYINRIDLPGPKVELADYFLFRPDLPPGLPEDHGPFALNVLFPFRDQRDGLRLGIQTVATDSPDTLGVILDLDYFLTQPQTMDVASVPDWVASAHDIIGDAFEACITDVLRERFHPMEE